MKTHTTAADEVKVLVDAINEMVICAAACADPKVRAGLVGRLLPDHFQAKEHRALWAALCELERRKMSFDVATLLKLAKDVDQQYVVDLMAARPEAPTHVNLEFHVRTLLWDHSRVSTVQGPLSALLDSIRDQHAEPDRVRALARQVADALAVGEDRKYLRDPQQLVTDAMGLLTARRDGFAIFPYGIDGLDYMERKGDAPRDRRIIPGAAPGQLTVLTAVSGGGKSTIASIMGLAMARPKLGRRVLFCAWEQDGNTSIELLTCMSLGWSRSRIQQGRSPVDLRQLSDEELYTFRERMAVISQHIRFLEVPFNRNRGEKPSNDRNLDLVQRYIADSGCDVIIMDLWKRCLRYTDPDDEEQALIRQQAMAQELKVHCILVQQQRLKDVETRPDKRPTREGIKGSGAWVEVPDTIIGVHRPGLWKGIEDNVLELDVLKQRYAKWPWAVEFDWDADKGRLSGGKTVAYDAFVHNRNEGAGMAEFFGASPKGRGR
jgi:replicative DNA helicase